MGFFVATLPGGVTGNSRDFGSLVRGSNPRRAAKMTMIDINEKALKDVFAPHHVVVAYLFGSQARGEATFRSDVDIAVLLSEEIPRERYGHVQLDLMVQLMEALHRDDVQVVILNSAPLLLKHRVLQDREILYCADERKRVQFESRVLSEYFDFDRVLEEYATHMYRDIK